MFGAKLQYGEKSGDMFFASTRLTSITDRQVENAWRELQENIQHSATASRGKKNQ